MVSQHDHGGDPRERNVDPVVLSEGAGVALGSVFNRLVTSKGSERKVKSTGKRPRSSHEHVILTANDEVREGLSQKREEHKRHKEARKAKIQFENNGRVIPDAATNAAMEKELLTTATKGAVALFNAVSKAQKAAEESANKTKKKGPPMSRDSFMTMMRASVNKEALIPEAEGANGDASSGDDDVDRPVKAKAKWLREDFLTARSKKLKDWDKEIMDDQGSGTSDDEDDGDDDDDMNGANEGELVGGTGSEEGDSESDAAE